MRENGSSYGAFLFTLFFLPTKSPRDVLARGGWQMWQEKRLMGRARNEQLAEFQQCFGENGPSVDTSAAH